MTSLRKITKVQHSDGCNIDGDRLEKGFNDIQDRVSNIPITDIKTRYKPNQLVGGYYCTKNFYTNISGTITSPSGVYNQTIFPFGQVSGRDNHISSVQMFGTNATVLDTADASFPASLMENPITVKGTNMFTNASYDATNLARHFCISQAYTTDVPIIIDSIAIEIQGDTLNPLNWNPISSSRGNIYSLPKWYYGNVLSMAQFVISVDDTDVPESVQRRTNEFLKQDFRMGQGAFFQTFGTYSSPATVTPSHPCLPEMSIDFGDDGMQDMYFGPDSLFFVTDKLNISIPQNSRWRLHILLPDVQGTLINKFDLMEREITWNVTFLEEIIEK